MSQLIKKYQNSGSIDFNTILASGSKQTTDNTSAKKKKTVTASNTSVQNILANGSQLLNNTEQKTISDILKNPDSSTVTAINTPSVVKFSANGKLFEFTPEKWLAIKSRIFNHARELGFGNHDLQELGNFFKLVEGLNNFNFGSGTTSIEYDGGTYGNEGTLKKDYYGNVGSSTARRAGVKWLHESLFPESIGSSESKFNDAMSEYRTQNINALVEEPKDKPDFSYYKEIGDLFYRGKEDYREDWDTLTDAQKAEKLKWVLEKKYIPSEYYNDFKTRNGAAIDLTKFTDTNSYMDTMKKINAVDWDRLFKTVAEATPDGTTPVTPKTLTGYTDVTNNYLGIDNLGNNKIYEKDVNGVKTYKIGTIGEDGTFTSYNDYEHPIYWGGHHKNIGYGFMPSETSDDEYLFQNSADALNNKKIGKYWNKLKNDRYYAFDKAKVSGKDYIGLDPNKLYFDIGMGILFGGTDYSTMLLEGEPFNLHGILAKPVYWHSKKTPVRAYNKKTGKFELGTLTYKKGDDYSGVIFHTPDGKEISFNFGENSYAQSIEDFSLKLINALLASLALPKVKDGMINEMIDAFIIKPESPLNLATIELVKNYLVEANKRGLLATRSINDLKKINEFIVKNNLVTVAKRHGGLIIKFGVGGSTDAISGSSAEQYDSIIKALAAINESKNLIQFDQNTPIYEMNGPKGREMVSYDNLVNTGAAWNNDVDPNASLHTGLRLASVGTDALSLWGGIPGIIGGAGSVILNTIANWDDPTLSPADKWKEFGINLGFMALALVPGLASAKVLKTAGRATTKAATSLQKLDKVAQSISKEEGLTKSAKYAQESIAKLKNSLSPKESKQLARELLRLNERSGKKLFGDATDELRMIAWDLSNAEKLEKASKISNSVTRKVGYTLSGLGLASGLWTGYNVGSKIINGNYGDINLEDVRGIIAGVGGVKGMKGLIRSGWAHKYGLQERGESLIETPIEETEPILKNEVTLKKNNVKLEVEGEPTKENISKAIDDKKTQLNEEIVKLLKAGATKTDPKIVNYKKIITELEEVKSDLVAKDNLSDVASWSKVKSKANLAKEAVKGAHSKVWGGIKDGWNGLWESKTYKDPVLAEIKEDMSLRERLGRKWALEYGFTDDGFDDSGLSYKYTNSWLKQTDPWLRSEFRSNSRYQRMSRKASDLKQELKDEIDSYKEAESKKPINVHEPELPVNSSESIEPVTKSAEPVVETTTLKTSSVELTPELLEFNERLHLLSKTIKSKSIKSKESKESALRIINILKSPKYNNISSELKKEIVGQLFTDDMDFAEIVRKSKANLKLVDYLGFKYKDGGRLIPKFKLASGDKLYTTSAIEPEDETTTSGGSELDLKEIIVPKETNPLLSKLSGGVSRFGVDLEPLGFMMNALSAHYYNNQSAKYLLNRKAPHVTPVIYHKSNKDDLASYNASILNNLKTLNLAEHALGADSLLNLSYKARILNDINTKTLLEDAKRSQWWNTLQDAVEAQEIENAKEWRYARDTNESHDVANDNAKNEIRSALALAKNANVLQFVSQLWDWFGKNVNYHNDANKMDDEAMLTDKYNQDLSKLSTDMEHAATYETSYTGRNFSMAKVGKDVILTKEMIAKSNSDWEVYPGGPKLSQCVGLTPLQISEMEHRHFSNLYNLLARQFTNEKNKIASWHTRNLGNVLFIQRGADGFKTKKYIADKKAESAKTKTELAYKLMRKKELLYYAGLAERKHLAVMNGILRMYLQSDKLAFS